MPIPQFPNFFFGSAQVRGMAAVKGMLVHAVIDYGQPSERRFSIEVDRQGLFGYANNGAKLKVGGVGEDIDDGAKISFFVTDGALPPAPGSEEAGHFHFYADQNPHITRLSLCQD